MKILVFGAKGMLGHDLMNVFTAPGYEIIGLDKQEVDITDKFAAQNRIHEIAPDFVINAAAYTAVDDCETNIDTANLVNGSAVGFIAEACKKYGSGLVHISTDYVFDGNSKVGYKEDDSPNPINAYGKSKLLGEQELLRAMADNAKGGGVEIGADTKIGDVKSGGAEARDTNINSSKNAKYYLVRTSWLYGVNGKNFVDTIINLGQSKPELNVVNDQIGKPTFTFDLAKAIKDLIESGFPSGIYHLVNENHLSWYDFTLEIFGLLNIKTPVRPVDSNSFPRPAKRPKCSILINNKRPHLRDHFDALKNYLGIKYGLR